MQKNRKRFEPFNVAILLSVLAGTIILFVLLNCAGRTTNPLTLKQQATLIMGIYNAENRDTRLVMSNPASTPAQKALGAKKRAILIKAHPLLKAYISIIDAGGVPDVETTEQITDLINQLVALGGEK